MQTIYSIGVLHSSMSCGVHLITGLHGMRSAKEAEKNNPDYVYIQSAKVEEQFWKVFHKERHDIYQTTIKNEKLISGKLATDIRCGMFLWSDATCYGNGIELAKFIRGNKLGKLWESDEVLNPNSSHQIQTWMFIPDWPEVLKWCEEYKPSKKDKKNEVGAVEVLAVPQETVPGAVGIG